MSNQPDSTLETYKQQRLKTPIGNKLSKEQNIRGIQELEKMMEGRGSSLSRQNSRSSLLKNLIDREAVSGKNLVLKTEQDIQKPMENYSEKEIERQIQPLRQYNGGVSVLLQFQSPLSKKASKKTELLKKFDVNDKRPSKQNIQPLCSPPNSSKNCSILSNRSRCSSVARNMPSRSRVNKNNLKDFIKKVQMMKNEVKTGRLVDDPSELLTLFTKIVDKLNRQYEQ